MPKLPEPILSPERFFHCLLSNLIGEPESVEQAIESTAAWKLADTEGFLFVLLDPEERDYLEQLVREEAARLGVDPAKGEYAPPAP